jgi:integrase
MREGSLEDSLSRIQIAERIFEAYREEHDLSEGLPVAECMTLDMMEYLQDRLLAGDESYLDARSPNTVNSMIASVMAFVRFCKRHGWISDVPPVEKLPVDDVMKGRPISGEEFERMLEATVTVVGKPAAESWKFALRILWESGFRIGDLMDFHWDDDRHIYPVWPVRRGTHPTIVIPSTQKNGKSEEIPMLPGLRELLESVPQGSRSSWVVNLVQVDRQPEIIGFRPTDADLRLLSQRHSNRSIAAACGVSDVSVRTWLLEAGVRRTSEFKQTTGKIPAKEVAALRQRSTRKAGQEAPRSERPTKEHVGRVIADIGEKANVIVRRADEQKSVRTKYASAHDLRRGCAQRLINAGVSAETLKLVMRHRDFATTEKFYGAIRSAQAAATELTQVLEAGCRNRALVGGLVGGLAPTVQLDEKELAKLKALLASL